MKTLPRCYPTVRGLRYSWAPISGLVRPSLASRATGASWAVSSLLRNQDADPLADGLTGSAQLPPGPVGERLHPHRLQHFAGGAQLPSRVDTPIFAAQPLAIQEMPTGDLGAQRGTSQVPNRLPKGVGFLSTAKQGAGPGLDAQRPRGRWSPAGRLGLPTPARPEPARRRRSWRCCLSQLGQHEGPVSLSGAELERPLGGV